MMILLVIIAIMILIAVLWPSLAKGIIYLVVGLLALTILVGLNLK